MTAFPGLSAAMFASQGAAATAAGGGGAAAGGTGLLAALGPAGIAIGVGTMAVGLLQSFQQNQATKRALEAQARALAYQRAQIRDQLAFEKTKLGYQTSSQRARASTLLAARGVAGGVSSIDLLAQASADRGLNASILETNARSAGRSATSSAQANIAQLRGQYQNPLFVGINSAFAGFQNALMVSQGLKALEEASKSGGGTWAGSGSGGLI